MRGRSTIAKIELSRVLRWRRVESTEAILLRKRRFSDTSLIVSWCTESLGCVQTIAKGARRPKSPFAGKLDLFFEAEISIVRGRKSDLFGLLRRAFGYLDVSHPAQRGVAHFETELARIAGVHDQKKLKVNPA